ncbi:MAG: diguanylate cyclase, partial [Proteobacteria bacterium]|nr:diguanylate cyclase [Pseudomonadota bacterium]
MQHGSTLWDLADAGLRHAQFLLPLLALLVAGLALRTARLHAKRAALQEHRLQALTDAAFDALLIVRAGQIVAANPAIVRLMGIGPAWFDQRRVDTLLDSPTSHPGPSREHSLILPDGSRHPVEVVTRPIEGTAEHVVAIRDLGPQQMTLAQIERLSHSDLLTGVGNRQALERSLNKMISMSDRSGAPFALLCIDLDRFRSINESLGPDAGDQVLIQSAGRLIATVRELDTVARVGSDEFAILQP